MFFRHLQNQRCRETALLILDSVCQGLTYAVTDAVKANAFDGRPCRPNSGTLKISPYFGKRAASGSSRLKTGFSTQVVRFYEPGGQGTVHIARRIRNRRSRRVLDCPLDVCPSPGIVVSVHSCHSPDILTLLCRLSITSYMPWYAILRTSSSFYFTLCEFLFCTVLR